MADINNETAKPRYYKTAGEFTYFRVGPKLIKIPAAELQIHSENGEVRDGYGNLLPAAAKAAK